MPVALVTGANRGIGLELVRAYRRLGYDVIATCRNPSADLDGSGARVVAGVDVASSACAQVLRAALGDTRVDLLINNAGLLRREGLAGGGGFDFDGLREQFEVNALGPLRVTEAVLPNMDRGARIALMTSRMGSIDDNTSGGAYGYRMSKAALNIAGKSLAVDLEPRGIAVVILHPGYVRTGMTGGMGLMDAPESAALLVERIEALSIETTGRFLHANGEELPW